MSSALSTEGRDTCSVAKRLSELLLLDSYEGLLISALTKISKFKFFPPSRYIGQYRRIILKEQLPRNT